MVLVEANYNERLEQAIGMAPDAGDRDSLSERKVKR